MSTATKTEAWTDGVVRVAIRADIYGPLALHPAVRLQDDPTGPREWRITHVPSGMSFPFGFRTKHLAIDAAVRIRSELDMDHDDANAFVKANRKKWDAMREEFLKAGMHA